MVQPTEAAEPSLPQFYAGRTIFVTGASGFMGKVLLERILATCPDVARLYLLMREKKNISPEKRILELKRSQVFDNIRQRSPAQLDKLVLVAGDVTQPELGMTREVRRMLREVSIVFHSAATVKFNEALKAAVEQNVRSVLKMLQLCDELPKLETLIHVSTTYGNSEHHRIEEKVYTPYVKLEDLLHFVDNTPTDVVDDTTLQYISPKPNTYTFTKAMAEHAVAQHAERRYSVAIFRPSIVVSTYRDPFPGWIENLNGPSGVIAGAGKGLMRVIRARGDARADMLPVDIAIDTVMAVAWETTIDKSQDVRVYNCTTGENPTTWAEFGQAINRNLRDTPLNSAIWCPHIEPISSRFWHKTLELFLQTIPQYLLHYMFQLFSIKSRHNFPLANKRMRAMDAVLSFFALNSWHFENGNVKRLRARLSPRDRQVFNLDPNTINWDDHFRNFVNGTRKYVLKENDADLPAARTRMRRLIYLYNGTKLLGLFVGFRLTYLNQHMRHFYHRALQAIFPRLLEKVH